MLQNITSSDSLLSLYASLSSAVKCCYYRWILHTSVVTIISAQAVCLWWRLFPFRSTYEGFVVRHRCMLLLVLSEFNDVHCITLNGGISSLSKLWWQSRQQLYVCKMSFNHYQTRFVCCITVLKMTVKYNQLLLCNFFLVL